MMALIPLAVVAFALCGVHAKDVLYSTSCESLYVREGNVYTYQTKRCQVTNNRNVPFSAMELALTSDLYPYHCNLGRTIKNYRLLESNGAAYIEVKEGCRGRFDVLVTKIAGSWGSWSAWSGCDEVCEQTRTRTCSTGSDSGCVGDSVETRTCPDIYGCTVQDNLIPEGLNSKYCGKANHQNGFRVVGGQDAKECEYPWMVLLFNHWGNFICGSSILDRRHLLTAAHCVENADTLAIYPAAAFKFFAGSSTFDIQKAVASFGAEKVTAHLEYTFDPRNMIQHDIAVVRTSIDLKLNQCQRPICLANGTTDIYQATKCRAMGWGSTTNGMTTLPKTLQWTGEEPVRKSLCRVDYQQHVTDNVFCGIGDGSGVCSGDSGGPFACYDDVRKRYYQYGIVSAGFANECGLRYALYVYAYQYYGWILNAMGP